MCGIVVLCGGTAKYRISKILHRISHRGPDRQSYWSDDQLAIGFVRLAINDESMLGNQPHQSGNLVSAINGEIYNASQLTSRYKLEPANVCDTHVVAPLFNVLGNRVLECLDGFFSGVVYKTTSNELYLLRDYIGKKPLFYGCSNGMVFVVSELKAIENIDWFEEVPLGINKIDLSTGKLTHVADHDSNGYVPANISLYQALNDAVLKRIPSQPFGMFLSGGLDSSIIAALLCSRRSDVTYFTLGDAESADLIAVNKLISHLGIKNIRYIPPPSHTEISEIVREVVYATESYNPSIISNGIATYLLAKAAKLEGIKVVLTGAGADELFAGYHDNLTADAWGIIRKSLIRDMKFTELRRLDACSMAFGIEARCPFLDKSVKQIADNLTHEQFYNEGVNKVFLRDTFRHLLPNFIVDRKKMSFDVGSGIRKLVVTYLTQNSNSEIDELRVIWRELFSLEPQNPYFYSYPTFNDAITKRGEVHR
jgi:asparagine synthase (glutamine-hydrolysing)